MKKILAPVLLITLLIFSSCASMRTLQQQNEKLIVGKWSFIKSIIPEITDTDLKSTTEELINDELKEIYFKYDKNNDFIAFYKGKESNGTWKISEDGTTIITDENGSVSEMKIKVLSKTELALVLDTDSYEVLLYFSK